MKRLSIPSYRLHKQSGQAIVTLPTADGSRHDVLLGPHGSDQSKDEYARVLQEWRVNGHRLRDCHGAAAALTVEELIHAFWKHAEQHYRKPDGTPTNELSDFRLSLRPLRRLYATMLARDFGPLALKAVRQKMIDAREYLVSCAIEGQPWQAWLPEERVRLQPSGQWEALRDKTWHAATLVEDKPALCRGVINQRIGRIVRMFKWAVSEELIAAPVHQALTTVRGLERGRSAARETQPVKPVPEAFVDATLPFLRPQVAAMVQLQLNAGMRPGEVVVMRAIDIDTKGTVWLYRPGSDCGPQGQHKTAHRGYQRIVPLGPRCQEIVKQWLRPDVTAYLFQPSEVMEVLRAEQRRKRKTKVQPSQKDRRRAQPKKKLGERYRVSSYANAIRRACEKANVPHWHPHQLRHTKATEIRREAGLDAARAVLGHRSTRITEVYADIDTTKATDIMERLG